MIDIYLYKFNNNSLLFIFNLINFKDLKKRSNFAPIQIHFLNFLKSFYIMDNKVKEFMAKVIAKNPGEVEFHQAVKEVVESLMPFIEENPKYKVNS